MTTLNSEFAEKVRCVRDTIIDCIKDLSMDKENLLPNLKTIKELTTVLKEMDRMDEREEKPEANNKNDDNLQFFENIENSSILRNKKKIDYEQEKNKKSRN